MFRNWPDLTNSEVFIISVALSLLITFLFKHPKKIDNEDN